jgi:hypothetical protein
MADTVIFRGRDLTDPFGMWLLGRVPSMGPGKVPHDLQSEVERNKISDGET